MDAQHAKYVSRYEIGGLIDGPNFSLVKTQGLLDNRTVRLSQVFGTITLSLSLAIAAKNNSLPASSYRGLWSLVIEEKVVSHSTTASSSHVKQGSP